MKKWKTWLFILFIFVAGIYALLQGGFGQSIIRKIITSSIESSGYKVKIGEITGALPSRIHLKDVHIQGEGREIQITQVELRPILWRLIDREIAFKDIHAVGISIDGSTPHNFDGKFQISERKVYVKGLVDNWKVKLDFYKKTRIAYFTLENPEVLLKGRANLTPEYELITAGAQISSDTVLEKIGAKGQILASVNVRENEGIYQGDLHWRIPYFEIDNKPLGELKGEGEASLQERRLVGQIRAGGFAKALFDLEITNDFLAVGTGTLEVESLESLHIPKTAGQLKATFNLGTDGEKQTAEVDALFSNLYSEPYAAESLKLSAVLNGPIDIEVKNGTYQDALLQTGALNLEKENDLWEYFLEAEGVWTRPFTLFSRGEFEELTKIQFMSLSGTYAGTPISLLDPIEFVWTEEEFRIPDAKFSVGNADAQITVDRKGSSTDAKVHAENIPLEFFSFNPIDTEIVGSIKLDAEIKERKNVLTGSYKASFSETSPFEALGFAEGTIAKERLELISKVTVDESPLLDLNVSLPIHLSLFPFEAEVLLEKSAMGKIAFDGRIEELLDFFNFGPHRLEGDLKADLEFQNTLAKPVAKGAIDFQNGLYENYYTGTTLKEIQAHFEADENTLLLKNLSAIDEPASGIFNMQGYVDLITSEHYPFLFSASFTHFRFAQIDLVTASADGKISIEGNALSALAKGDVVISDTELTIPDKIPSSLPNLQVFYRNENRFVPPPEPTYKPYPLFLDLSVSAPEIAIGGRGLDSKWKGDFNLGGRLDALATQGKMDLVQGQFTFSTRTFKLTEGALTFSGKEEQMPHLNIAGNTETKGIMIIARLDGPLDNPQITLQSTPALPLSSIMSYLLFGQDVSEIGGYQALQLATSLAAMAGTGPDVLESTRKSLGVDRLRIVTDPSEEGEETISLQVGKYVTKGVLVSFTQGAEESSTNISVEIELKDNFIFQIESDQKQEQGRFTLKWARNY